MARNTPNSSESQLDALIARIHGLSSTVTGKSPTGADGSSRTGKGPEVAEPQVEHPIPPATRPVPSTPTKLFKDHVPGTFGSVQPGRGGPESGHQGDARIDHSTDNSVRNRLREAANDGLHGEGQRDNQGGGDLHATSANAERTSAATYRTSSTSQNSAYNSTLPGNFSPSRDEPWRPREPESLEEAGILDTTVEQLVLKFLLARGEVEGRQVADQIKIPFRLVEPILEWLKMEQSLAHKRGTVTGDFAYILTDKGRTQAKAFNSECTYFGVCPVPLNDYIDSVKYQTVEGQKPQKNQLLQAFSDLLINPHMLDRLGPAINSGRGMFLYGFPGNGKTSIAERVTAAFGKWIWVPRAVDVDGDILRVYDRMNHEADMPEAATGFLDQGGFDKRWIRIKRPTIVVGGELTMEMLEVQSNAQTNISEAPLQMKSNCGTLVIDDFGRQKMSVDQLLNRWIVPLEKRFDFLNMRSGKKIQVPFDQLVIFSTNLEPRDLVDDAFLRRIPYKIEVCNPSEADFRKLFEIMCRVLKVPYQPGPIDHLIETHYRPTNRPFRNCQPRDLLLQVQNYCRYHSRDVELRNEYFDYAVENYFSIM